MTHTGPPPRPSLLVGPGWRLARELDERGWSQRDLAEVIGRPVQAINEIVKGSKQITPDTAIQLGQAIGPSAEFWLTLETTYRLRLAEANVGPTEDVARRRRLFELVPIAELERRGWIRASSSDRERELAVCRFFEIDSLEAQPVLPIARPRQTSGRVADGRSWDAWIKRAQWLARGQEAAPFDSTAFRAAVPALMDLATSADSANGVAAALKDVGVRIVVVPHLPKTYVDGAAFWIQEGPVVALSLRYDRLDYLWFTLAHELAHVDRDDREGVVDDDHADRDKGVEDDANRRAQDWLIDPARFAKFRKSLVGQPTRGDVEAFAAEVRRHPSIVVGRLQYEGILTYAQFRVLQRAGPAPFTRLVSIGLRLTLGRVEI